MNIIWLFLICLSILLGIANKEISSINQLFSTVGLNTLETVFSLIALSAFFNGWLNVAKECHVIDFFVRLSYPLLKRVFPDLKNEKEALGYISSNIIMNMFGLGSAATISGLKAMNEMQRINPNKEVASRSMITFIILNTAGITLFGSTVISLRMKYGSTSPLIYLPLAIFVSTLTSIFALCIDAIVGRAKK